ncbi:MAG: diacylglycerol kinase family protein [Nesterenkonia sp.]|uniref:diacylglycerol/lipid kinase family protein n=1 Tax=Nesterenkonia marinintestina TaxID=2979865 RepID=UPI0021C17F35|nr:diacylglycerol kinase family protein [Nesterenkonia sp. GX14115]MDO5492441.1 diacylglycerol kinase family protein [Nesterenkonia sp.]
MGVQELQVLLGVAALLAVVAVAVMVGALISNRRLRSSLAQLQDLREQEAQERAAAAAQDRRRVGLVLNPTKAEATTVARQVHRACSRAGIGAPMIYETTASDPGYSMAREAVADGADVVLAAGGDGTVRKVAAALADGPVSLGVIPMGTGNLFARNIGLPYHDLEACIDEALHGPGSAVDIVDLALTHLDGAIVHEHSLVIAGAGMDAEVMGGTRDVLKERAGWLAYGEAGARHLIGHRHPVTFSVDHEPPRPHKVRSVLLANCGSLQAGMVLVPSARFDDGRLDTVLFTPRHLWDWIRIVAKTVTRSSAELPVMQVRQGRTAVLESQEPMPFQIDGDALGEVVRVEAGVRAGAVQVNGVLRLPARRQTLAEVLSPPSTGS